MQDTFAAVRFGPRSRVVTLVFLLFVAGCGKDPEKFLASGRQYLSRGDCQAASIQFKNALQERPTHAEARYLLGTCQLKLGEYSSAEKELRKANELGFSADKVVPAIALALIGQGKLDELVLELSNKQLSDPQAMAELQTRVGDAYVSLRRLSEAQDAYARALDAKPGDPRALVGQSKILAAKGNVARALRDLDEVLETRPKQPEALTLKASLVRSQGKADEAIGYLRQVVQLQPENVPAAFSLVSLLLERGNLNEASQEIDSIRKFAAGDPRIIYLQAALAFRQGNFLAARDFALQVLKASPENLPGLTLAGVASYELNDQRQTQDYLRKVLERTPQALNIRKVLVNSYLRTGDVTAAFRLLEESSKEARSDPGLQRLAAEVAVAHGDLDAAAKLYRQAENAAPGTVVAPTRLAEIEFAQGSDQEAIRILESLSASNKEQAQSDAMLALYYAVHGQSDKALGWIGSLEKKEPQSPLPPTLLGSIHLRNKAYPAARAEFERALARQDDFIPALEGLARVDVAEKKPEAGKKRFEDQLKKAPGNVMLALRYARFLRESGVPLAEVAEVFRQAIKSQPTALELRANLISLYLELGDGAQAKVAAQEALAASPENRELLTLAGQAQLASGDRNGAVAIYEKLVSLEPHSVPALMLLADAHIANRDRPKAIAALKQALELQYDLLEAQVRLFQLYAAERQTREALAVARDIQRQRPTQPTGYQAEATVLTKARDYDEAARVLEKGFKLTSSWVLVPPLHKLLVKMSRQSEADSLVKKWIDGHPRDVNVRTYLAQRAMDSKNYELAARWLKEILSLEPNAGVALNNLAWVAAEMHDPRAVEYAERANQLLPDAPPVMDTLGWLLVEKGDGSRGVALLQKAVEMAPQLYGIRIHLAKGLIQTNQKEAARKELEYLESHLEDEQSKTEVAALLREL
jgi:cellulose synthase operon protein C